MAQNPDSLLIFDTSTEEERKGKKEGAETPSESKENTQASNAGTQTDASSSSITGKPIDIKLSREKAKGQNCAWHPWRKAYALCAYCNRPFCFQDVVEFNKTYYCVEDLDTVAPTHERHFTAARNMAILVGALLILAAFMFFYLSYNQLAYVLQSIQVTGFQILADPVFIDLILMLLGLIAALFLFAQSRNGYYIGALASLGLMITLTYQIVNLAPTYYKILDVVALISFILLLYSRVVAINEGPRLRSEASTTKSNLSRWPNAGKF